MKNCVLTVGKFEAIHLGHRALLAEVARRAAAANSRAVVLTFDPHPRKTLHEADYRPIFTREERDGLLKSPGIDEIISLRFDEHLAAMSDENFCEEIFKIASPKEIIVGENFRFGKDRAGDAEFLKKFAAGENCAVQIFATVGIVSTSRIREFLAAEDFANAAALLGFDFFIEGTVEEGKKLGRTLGFPTMNIYPHADKFLPKNGVYATRTTLDGVAHLSLTNIGVRPTVAYENKLSVESFIPNFATAPDAMYGRHIKVEFLKFIRAEKRFNSVAELKLQIEKDKMLLTRT